MWLFLWQSTVEEGYDLTTGAILVGGEETLAGAVGDTFFYSPEDGGVIVVGLFNIRKGIGGCSGSGLTPLRPAKAQIKQELCIYQFVIKRLLLDYYTTKKPQKQGNSEYNYEFCELWQ